MTYDKFIDELRQAINNDPSIADQPVTINMPIRIDEDNIYENDYYPVNRVDMHYALICGNAGPGMTHGELLKKLENMPEAYIINRVLTWLVSRDGQWESAIHEVVKRNEFDDKQIYFDTEKTW